jgi:hypothetical protein
MATSDEQKQVYCDYRQKLRDIPQDLENPEDIIFTEKP